jgi:hypothetical protein
MLVVEFKPKMSAQRIFSNRKFFIESCSEKPMVKKLVGKNGGTLVDQYEIGCVHLAPYDTRTALNNPAPSDHAVYSYKFVVDSNTLGEEQSISNYLLIAPAAGMKKQRLPYTRADEKIMEEYVDNNPGVPSGIRYWEKAFREGLNKHSPESMRRHYRLIHKEKPFQKRGVIIPISKPRPAKSMEAARKALRKKFEKLVRVATTLTKAKVNTQQVFTALMSNNGDVEQTLLDLALR